MVRILAYGMAPDERGALRTAVDRLMSKAGWNTYSISFIAKTDELIGLVERTREGFYDIVVGRLDDQADETLVALRRVREADGGMGIVLVADDDSHAVDAFDLRADGYSLIEDGAAGLEKALHVAVLRAASNHSVTLGLRADVGVGNLIVDEVEFVEASKKGPIIHLSTGKTVTTRGTLQSLFEQLEHDERFVKAGNSFIVNLDNIRSLGEGSVVFPDGEAIIIPVRTRKPIKDALTAYRLRPEFVPSPA